MTTDTPTHLPCGCKRGGSCLCAEAERLWRASRNAWRAGDYAEYARLRQEYEAHFYLQVQP